MAKETNIDSKLLELSMRMEVLRARSLNALDEVPESLSAALETLEAGLDELSAAYDGLRRQKEPIMTKGDAESDPRTFRLKLKPEFASDCAVVQHALATVTDITRHKQADEALWGNAEELRLIAYGIPLQLTHISADLHYLFVNRSFAEWVGLQSSEIVGRHISEVLSKEDFEADLPNIKRVLSGEKVTYDSTVSGDGLRRHLNVNLAPQLDGSGAVVAYHMIAQDVTESKQIESILQTNLQRFYAVLSSMYAGILLVKSEGQIEYANQEFCNLFGLLDSPGSLIGLTPDEMIEKIKNSYLYPDEAVARVGEIVRLG